MAIELISNRAASNNVPMVNTIVQRLLLQLHELCPIFRFFESSKFNFPSHNRGVCSNQNRAGILICQLSISSRVQKLKMEEDQEPPAVTNGDDKSMEEEVKRPKIDSSSEIAETREQENRSFASDTADHCESVKMLDQLIQRHKEVYRCDLKESGCV